MPPACRPDRRRRRRSSPSRSLTSAIPTTTWTRTPTTTSSPVEAEALGLGTVTATFAGRPWRIPLDVDTWPLDAIRGSVGVNSTGEVVVGHGALVTALGELLGDQFEQFLDAAPTRAELIPASHAFAAAVGIGKTPDAHSERYDRAFGAIPRLLALVDHMAEAVEADLARFWGVDYRDRWRFDADGRRRLTLRQIHARLSHLPADSAVAIAMNRRSPMELLLMDLYEPLAGRPHPARPLSPEQAAERNAEAARQRKAREDYEKRRAASGHRRVPDGLETARANALRGRSAHAQEGRSTQPSGDAGL